MSFFTEEDHTNDGTQNTTPKDQDSNQEDWITKVVEQKGEHWKDPQVIAKGYASAQSYIKELEAEREKYREELMRNDYSAELLKTIREGQAKPPVKEPPRDTDGTQKDHTNLEVDEDKLKSLIENTLTQREKQNTTRQNLAEADKKLTEMFGSNVGTVMQEKSRELGMSKERLAEIASESPTAFFRLIGSNAPKETNSLPKGTVNTTSNFTGDSGTKNNSYYQKLRRENPRLFNSPKVQNEMFKQRLELGQKFYE